MKLLELFAKSYKKYFPLTGLKTFIIILRSRFMDSLLTSLVNPIPLVYVFIYVYDFKINYFYYFFYFIYSVYI
jgi:hypothetical protein